MIRQKKFSSSVRELAVRYQVQPCTIVAWLKEGAPAKISRGYCIADWDDWISKNKTKDNGDDESKVGLEKQKLREVIRGLKRANEIAEGKLLESEEVDRLVFAMCSRAKAVFLRFPKNIGALLGVEAEKKAQDVVTEVLKELEDKPL